MQTNRMHRIIRRAVREEKIKAVVILRGRLHFQLKDRMGVAFDVAWKREILKGGA